jgi:hypothetical protein
MDRSQAPLVCSCQAGRKGEGVRGSSLGRLTFVGLLMIVGVGLGFLPQGRPSQTAGAEAIHGRPAAAHLRRQAVQPGEVRLTLERYLGHHAITAVRLMRAQVNHSPDLIQSLKDALSANTEDLTATIKSVHGPQEAQTFRRLWTRHLVSLVSYTEALDEGDEGKQQQHLSQLDDYRTDFGSFVESATDSRLKQETVAASLKIHIDQLVGQVDAYAAGDYATAYRMERKAFAHMFPTGTALAGGFTGHQPGEFTVDVDEAAQSLESALALLLGEHAELLVDATRSGVSGSPEFRAAADALDANTQDLTAAMGAVFGKKDAAEFNDIWSDHIDLIIDYTVARRAGKEDAQQEALQKMKAFDTRFPNYLARVTGESGSKELSNEIAQHEDLLVEQLNAYADKDYATAHDVSNEAYQDMFITATELGELVGGRFSKVAPLGGAQTGGGGTS